jgi:hypothetical protein
MALGQDRSAWNEKRRKRYAEDSDYREKRKAKRRAHHAAHKEEVSESKRRSGWRKRLSVRWRRLLRCYGLSMEQYETLLAKQGGVCAICARPPAEPPVVDHCHETGTVRGLLCRKCNFGLGLFGDDQSLLAAASAYLKKGVAGDEA